MERTSLWWNTMGFTKTHVVCVFAAESIIVLSGIVMAIAALSTEGDARQELLLGAILMGVFACTVLLGSLLSLLFYIGFDLGEWIKDKNDNKSMKPNAIASAD